MNLKLYDNLKKRGLEVIAAYRNENQWVVVGES
ncbi:MAG: hypothetical protein Ct9H90mP17_3490 [Actinomycetota bacterium]|nr:MAG: hypothetical protein Ct9H90mP17_3490 [Actinomycetota bacterium]